MSEFMEPIMILRTMEDVRRTIAEPKAEYIKQFPGMGQFRIRSAWLVELIGEIETGGEYPYNATVKRLAEQRLGFAPKSDAEYSREGDTLSLLIYNAQCFRRSDKLKSAGYQPFTSELLQRAFKDGRKIETAGGSVLKPREVSGNVLAMKLRSRKLHIPPIGQAVRIMERGK